MSCPMCDVPEEYKSLLIKDFKYWRLELRSQQNYLGWIFVVLKRHLPDIFDITKSEQSELLKIAKRARDSLKISFNPDMFNYASYGNETPHAHLQIIPRYKKPVRFNSVTFVDKNWGHNYSPYDKSFIVSDEIKLAIRDTIKINLE